MSVSVKERNEVYVQRKHAVVRNKKNRATPSRVEVKSLYLIGKSNTSLGQYEIDTFQIGTKLTLLGNDTVNTYTIATARYNNSRRKLVITLV